MVPAALSLRPQVRCGTRPPLVAVTWDGFAHLVWVYFLLLYPGRKRLHSHASRTCFFCLSPGEQEFTEHAPVNQA